MVSGEDIMITAKLKDEVSNGVDRIQSKFKHMSSESKAAISNAMNTASTAIISFSKDAVQSAMTAEAEWTRFGSAVNATGGNWDSQSAEVKKWVREFSDSMGRATSDTRAAMTAYMNYGMSLEQSQSAMKATAGVAAAMGSTEEEASTAVIQALNGRGLALKKLGVNMDDYKDSVTGTIDKEKLLNDLQARFGEGAEKYAQTAAGKFQTLQNTIASLKTEFGASLMDAITPLIPVVKGLLQAFQSLPGPVKTVMFGFVALVGAIGMLAGPVMSVIGILETLGIIGPAAGAGATEAGAGAAAGSTGFWALSASLFGVEIPIWLIIAAILALIAIVYLVGQYFGLWNDPMEMCQVILGALAGALQYVASILMGAFKLAWDTIMNVFVRVRTFLTVLQMVFTSFANGQMSLSQVIKTIWEALNSLFGNIFNKILSKVITFTLAFVNYAKVMAQRFVSNLIGGITSLPSRVWNIFLNVIRMIQNAVSQAGQAAQNLAQAVWDGLTGKLGEFASWVNDNIISPVTNALGLGGSAAGSEDLPRTALEAGTYIATGSLGRTGVTNTTNNRTSKATLNIGEINLKLDNVNDAQAKRILVQALDGLEQVKEVRI